MQVANHFPAPRNDIYHAMNQPTRATNTPGNSAARGIRQGNQDGFHAAASYEAMRYDSTRLTLTSSDGTTLSVEKQQLVYTREGVAVDSNGSSIDPKSEMTRHIVSQLRQMKQSILQMHNPQKAEKNEQTAPSEEIAQVPEYWNAENTSNRIVDFATQFFSAFEGTKSEYGEIIRDAIEKGFAEAKEILGELPTATNNLVQKTHELTMQKLDAWIEEEPGDEKTPQHDSDSIAA